MLICEGIPLSVRHCSTEIKSPHRHQFAFSSQNSNLMAHSYKEKRKLTVYDLLLNRSDSVLSFVPSCRRLPPPQIVLNILDVNHNCANQNSYKTTDKYRIGSRLLAMFGVVSLVKCRTVREPRSFWVIMGHPIGPIFRGSRWV